jgi:hypothetical protein
MREPAADDSYRPDLDLAESHEAVGRTELRAPPFANDVVRACKHRPHLRFAWVLPILVPWLRGGGGESRAAQWWGLGNGGAVVGEGRAVVGARQWLWSGRDAFVVCAERVMGIRVSDSAGGGRSVAARGGNEGGIWGSGCRARVKTLGCRALI